MGKMNVIERLWSDKPKLGAEVEQIEDAEPAEEDVDFEEDATPMASQPIKWATFILPLRVSTQSTVVPAVIASPTITLTVDTWEGERVLVVDDVAIGEPVRVPWRAVASFGAD